MNIKKDKVTLGSIAREISAFLNRFEKAEIEAGNKFPDFYHAHAYRGGKFVRVVYVSYQGASSLTKDEALDYLNWLKSGNVGTHYMLEREKERSK